MPKRIYWYGILPVLFTLILRTILGRLWKTYATCDYNDDDEDGNDDDDNDDGNVKCT